MRLAKLDFYLAATLLASIVVLVFVAAILRWFRHPLIWSIDMAQMLFIWLCFVGAFRAMRMRVHLGVDLLVRGLSRPARLWIETAQALVFIAFLGTLVIEGYKLTTLNIERIFGDSGMSYAWVNSAVPIGSLMMIVAIVANMVEAWRGTDPAVRIFTGPPKPPEETAL
jgi:TRAP-type C4-dicarboxylate transport system permease small subunit